MSWNYGFFISKNNLFQKQEVTSTKKPNETTFTLCSKCNQPIGTISTTLYKIEEKLLCSECYSKMITNQAAERDRSAKLEKQIIEA